MMECDEVRGRLVALHDDELSPSEGVQVREHVGRCISCGARERRLRATLPSPAFGPLPDAVRARFSAALDPSLILALAEEPVERVRPVPLRGVWSAVTRAASVPMGAVVVYLVLLAGSFAWGVSNWWTLAALREPSAIGARPSAGATGAPTAVSGTAIPADQFRPAAYDPSAEADGH